MTSVGQNSNRGESSKNLNARARTVIPGGVNSPVRAFRSVGGEPFVAASAAGAHIRDVDGNEYIDLVSSWGAVIHGHNYEPIRRAITDALPRGTSYGITAEPEFQLCELIVKSVPALEMVRLVNSGTEACMSAIRLARGFTGRDLILKFEGHYHGHGDSFLVSAGSGVATLQIAGSEGLPKELVSQTLVAPFNDLTAIENIFSQYGNRLAGVILELVSGNMGLVRPDPKFLHRLRALCSQYGALFIADEVMTGFRLSLTGAHGLYALDPDLICLGKVIGGGLPVGAYGGKKKIMEKVAPLGGVYQAGTLSGNPICVSAGLAALKGILAEEKLFYQELDSNASEWASRVTAHIQHKGYEACVEQLGSMVSIFFSPEAPRNFEEVKATRIDRFNHFFWACLKRGLYFPPSAYESCFLNRAHTGDVVDRMIKVSEEALDETFREIS